MRRLPLAITVGLLAVAVPVLAHTALKISSPEKDEVLERPPTELRLIFNERVDPKVAALRLLAADSSAVALGELASGDSAQVLRAAVTGPVAPGRYTVYWQVVGRDGHPVRGNFAFTVAEPPAPVDTAPAPAVSSPADPLPGGDPEPAALSVTSPTYVAVRWLTYAALVVAIGAVGFRILLGKLRGTSAAADALVAPASERAAAIGRGALVFLLLAAGARLLTQFAAIGVPLGDFAFIREVMFRTVWGWGWILQVVGAIVGFAAFHAARRTPESGWRLAAVAAVLLAVTPALSGHAAGVPRLAGLAVLADSAHVLAIAGWLGTLLLLVGVGLPEAFRADAANGASAVAAMVRAFSPAALTLAGIAAATGLLAAVFQLNALQDLWTTPYGRMLLVKLGFVAAVVAAGAWNWRRIKPRLASADDAAMLRKSATVELAGAAIVLLVTAILVALPTP